MFKCKHVLCHFYFQELLKYSTSCDGVQELQEALVAMLDLLKSVNDSMHQISITGYDVSGSGHGEPWHRAGDAVGMGLCRVWELAQSRSCAGFGSGALPGDNVHLISGVWGILSCSVPTLCHLVVFQSIFPAPLCVLMADLITLLGCFCSISHSAFNKRLSG